MTIITNSFFFPFNKRQQSAHGQVLTATGPISSRFVTRERVCVRILFDGMRIKSRTQPFSEQHVCCSFCLARSSHLGKNALCFFSSYLSEATCLIRSAATTIVELYALEVVVQLWGKCEASAFLRTSVV